MQLRSLGRGAVPVSAVGHGGMHLSTATARPTEAIAIRTLHAALDAGVTLIDTADVYALDHTEIGHNERLIAKALACWPGTRESVIVATKGGMIRPDGRWERDARPERLRRACDRSLKALGVERIDLYQLHAPDHQVPFEESVGTLFELQREGKVRWVGLSNVSVAEIKAAEALGTVTSVQNRLSPFFREALETGVVKYCTERGLGFLAYSPTGGGRLNKRLPGHPVLAPMARDLGVSAHALVIAWALAQSECVIPIPSARTPEHAADSARAADLTLSARDLAAITEAAFDRT
jgi:aryl-alcohol dehydrogenase-like predicted oxidoreductase